MLGHELVASLSRAHEVKATLRREAAAYAGAGFTDEDAFFEVDVRRPDAVLDVCARYSPEAIVNAAGVVKQRQAASDPLASIEVNALFPHRLARLCHALGARLVNISTDCVFSGRRGSYAESDAPDPVDLYGRSKLLGEVADDRQCVTLRTSMIGLELGRRQGLVEWFLASRGKIRGFRRAVFSGLTTLELARVVGRILGGHPELYGLCHVAAEPIDKYTLLTRLASALRRDDIEIEPDDGVVCDRSLSAEALRRATGYSAPSWDAMLDELVKAIQARREQG